VQVPLVIKGMYCKISKISIQQHTSMPTANIFAVGCRKSHEIITPMGHLIAMRGQNRINLSNADTSVPGRLLQESDSKQAGVGILFHVDNNVKELVVVGGGQHTEAPLYT
jgi:hypothetical protein